MTANIITARKAEFAAQTAEAWAAGATNVLGIDVSSDRFATLANLLADAIERQAVADVTR